MGSRLSAVVALGAGLLLAACTSSTSGSGGTPPGSGQSSTSGSTATAGSNAGGSGPGYATGGASSSSTNGGGTNGGGTNGGGTNGGGTNGGGMRSCTNAQIAVTAAEPPGGSAAGHTGVLLLFTNHSSSTCALTGYPGVAGLDSAGNQLAQATRTLNGYLAGCGCGAPTVLTLHAGAVASAIAEGTIGGPGDCDQFTAMLVTPPNTTGSAQVDIAPHSCGFTVHPVVAGSAGSAPPS